MECLGFVLPAMRQALIVNFGNCNDRENKTVLVILVIQEFARVEVRTTGLDWRQVDAQGRLAKNRYAGANFGFVNMGPIAMTQWFYGKMDHSGPPPLEPEFFSFSLNVRGDSRTGHGGFP